LTTAIALRQSGVDVVVLEKRPVRDAMTSRAMVVHARSLEVLGSLGVIETLVVGGHRASAFAFRDGAETLLRLPFDDLPTKCPYMLLVPQWRTEQILEERRTAGHKGPLRVDFHGAAPACPFPVVADDGRRFEPVPDVHRHADRSPSRIPCGPKVVPKQPPAWLLLRPKAHRGDLFRWQHRSRACRVHSASVVSGPST
jgi:hypothetical protein